MGRNNRICHGALLGCEPQDLSYDPANGKPLTIGDDNHFKEGVNISRGVFNKGLGVSDLQGNFVPIILGGLLVLALSTALLKKQER